MPSGWPHLGADEDVLAPFLGCTSPAAFLALQREADMSRLVESLSDWNAVQLGALGPWKRRPPASSRASAPPSSPPPRQGPAKAEVLALFVLHTACDDEVRSLLRLLAEDRLLSRTLGPMEVVREELRQRGLALADFPERGFRGGDIARGLGRGADDVVPLIGAHLGQVLVKNLGGQWIPRKKLEETQVRVGDRMWLPFVRARRYLRSRQTVMDYSLTQFYREAERHPSSGHPGR